MKLFLLNQSYKDDYTRCKGVFTTKDKALSAMEFINERNAGRYIYNEDCDAWFYLDNIANDYYIISEIETDQEIT